MQKNNDTQGRQNRSSGRVPRRFRALAWLNIGIQVSFPLAVSFTPVLAANAGQASAQYASVPTRPYTLLAGEDAPLVAQRFGISVEELRQLNQLRTFSRGFDHLRPGDEVDVPVAPRRDNPAAAGTLNDGLQAQRVAGVASQAGTFLASNPNGDAAASLARGMATGEAGRQVQDWMSQFGTARVQLDVDQRFSLKNSQFDLLVPLYERQDLLAFMVRSLDRFF